MNYEVAVGCMKMISNIGREGFLDGLGVSKGDFDRLVGDAPWLGCDRNRMTSCLHALLNASVDSMGLPRFNLPAEFVAAGISVFVSPVNLHSACVFTSVQGTAEDIGRMATVCPTTPDQLFALVVQLYGSQARSAARAQFMKHTGLELEKTMNVVDNGKKK